MGPLMKNQKRISPFIKGGDYKKGLFTLTSILSPQGRGSLKGYLFTGRGKLKKFWWELRVARKTKAGKHDDR